MSDSVTPIAAGRYIDWGAVVAGALAASVLAGALYSFGSAIGLSFVSPWPGARYSPRAIASVAVFWVLATQILSFLAGGYIAGRVRSEWPELTTDQVEFRDGMHGLLVWALGVLIGGLLLASTVLSVAKGAPNTVLSAAVTTEPVEYQTDVLLRPRQSTQLAGAASAAAGATATTLESGRVRAEINRILSKNLGTGQLSEPDRVYIAQIISQYTGVAAPEAQARMTDAFAELMRSAKQAADKARQAGILTGLITGIGLLVALAAAWWAANRGGYHRDHTIHVRLFPHRQAGARV